MKKILIFALLLVFAAFPAFSQVTIGGELDYYMVNGFDNEETSGKPSGDFQQELDKAEVNFSVDLGDYNSVSVEFESKDTTNGVELDHFTVSTDWAMMFGLEGFTLATTVGVDGFETFDNVDFTGIGYENADNYDNNETDGTGFKADLGFVDGLIQPYFAMAFDTEAATKGAGTWIIGSGFDMNGLLSLPLWLEVYYGATAVAEKNTKLGIEAAYNLATEGGMMFDIGGFLQIATAGENNTNTTFGAGVGFGIDGIALGASFMGRIGDSYKDDLAKPISMIGVDAEYFFLEWLGVNAGASLSLAKDTDILQVFEAGIVAMVNEDVTYKLGYMQAADKDINDDRRTLNTDGEVIATGIYFAAVVNF